VGDHSYAGADEQEQPPGTVIGPDGEPFGPASDTSRPDVGGVAGQDLAYEEVEDLDPDDLPGGPGRGGGPMSSTPTPNAQRRPVPARLPRGIANNDNEIRQVGMGGITCRTAPSACRGRRPSPVATDVMGGKWAYCPSWVNHWRARRAAGTAYSPRRPTARRHRLLQLVRHATAWPIMWASSSPSTGSATARSGAWSPSSSTRPAGSRATSPTAAACTGRRRSTLYAVGYGRPHYKTQSRPVPLPSRRPQPAPHAAGRSTASGVSLTTQHLSRSGSASPLTGRSAPPPARPCSARSTSRPDGEPGDRQTRRALQKVLGVRQDGEWGPQHRQAALQRMLNRTPSEAEIPMATLSP
jgi:hypothetical protein